MEKSIAEIAGLIQAELEGDPHLIISGLAEIDTAKPGHIVFAENEAWFARAEASEASAIIIPRDIKRGKKTVLKIDKPKMAFGMLMHIYAPPLNFSKGIHPTAVIGTNAVLDDNVSIQPYAVVDNGAVIGKGTVIGAHCYVGQNAVIGEKCILHAHSVVYARMRLGNKVILHSGVIVGPDGFGYVEHNKKRVKVPQIGIVVIGDDVEIGSNTTIDRATLGETRIGAGTKIDNLVQIAHNDLIGENCIFCAQSGVSGSTKVGNNVIVAGQAGLGDHVTIEDNVVVGAQAGIPSNKLIRGNQMVFGAPARNADDMKKQMGAQLRLPKLVEKVKQLEEQIQRMETLLEKIPSDR